MFQQTKVLQNHDIFLQSSRSDLINNLDNPPIILIDSNAQPQKSSFLSPDIIPNKKRGSGNFIILIL